MFEFNLWTAHGSVPVSCISPPTRASKRSSMEGKVYLSGKEKQLTLLNLMPPVHSKLQREVLRLYRDLLRAASSKSPDTEAPTVTRNPQLYKSIQKEFRRQANLYKKTDILQIEAAVRRGRRRLEDLQSGTVDRVSRLQLDISGTIKTASE
ncbi:hypothetical protein EG68_08677 [Paragonimus skrjabini miyazakii]|uniref:Complex 1 LYR protein domain-containing protein n=1 Tax=Paragonimus skrjabini miyazakii TaxID=59628 RepID=A0A8S9YFQ8_9TREM|nr:hypothetical protein EG68_08677 [Paragonimus skrjabini miyazakii]